MTRGNKTIKGDSRGKIQTLKNMIRYSTRPFDGTGYVFKTAIAELRSEGINIKYIKDKCHYILE